MRRRNRLASDTDNDLVDKDLADEEVEEHLRALMATETDPILPARRPKSYVDPLDSNRPPSTARKTTALFILLLAYTLTSLLVHWRYEHLPEALPAADNGQVADYFSGVTAWQHLQQIASKPHPLNSHANDDTRKYLVDTLQRIKQEANAAQRPMDLEAEARHVYLDGNTAIDADLAKVAFEGSQIGIFYHSSNILVRLLGTNSSQAVLVSVHYDSAPTSNGATDDGMAVAAVVEVIRALLQHPRTHHTLIFNINNGEEVSLLGSRAFLSHPWAADVRSFINIEGGGVGGKPMLFQASGPQVLDVWANSVLNTHGNVIANDMFAAGIIKSATDYAIYQQRWPGMDMAYYQRRGWYHTARDSIESIFPGSLQYVGENLLAYTLAAANTLELPPRAEATFDEASPDKPTRLFLVYYDLFGRWMITRAYSTYQLENVLLLLGGLVAVALVCIRHTHQAHNAGMSEAVTLVAYTSLQTLYSTLLIVVVGAILSAILAYLAPVMIYTRPHWTLVIMVLLCVYILDYSRYHRFYCNTSGQFRMAGLAVVWMLATVLAALVAAFYSIGSLYYVRFGLLGVVLALTYSLVSESISPQRSGGGFVRLLLCALLPSAALMDLSEGIMAGFVPTITDGTPPFALYLLTVVLALAITLPLAPFMPKRPVTITANSAQPWASAQLQFMVVILVVLMFYSGYTAEAPAKVILNQVYTPYNDSSRMTMIAARDIELIQQHTPGYENGTCEMIWTRGKQRHGCTWPFEAPVFKRWPPVSIREAANGVLEVDAPESRYCYIDLPYAQQIAVSHPPDNQDALSADGLDDDTLATDGVSIPPIGKHRDVSTQDWAFSNTDLLTAVVIRGKLKQPWAFRALQGKNGDLIRVRCQYDDIARHTPHLKKLRESLPDWIQVWGSGTNILQVHTSIQLSKLST